jgi:hypothetical protein
MHQNKILLKKPKNREKMHKYHLIKRLLKLKILILENNGNNRNLIKAKHY